MSGAGPSLLPGEFPPWSVLKFPPNSYPKAIPPPFEGYSFKTPFPIPENWFNASLPFKVPLTIATVYATSVVALNQYNKRHGNKPWAISKTRIFKALVILHNVFLAVYSAATCIAMVRALRASFPHYSEPNAFVGTVDALCKMNGPRGLGNAASYDEATGLWTNKNSSIHMDANGLPASSDVGRIWNEGLAWWGWWFYLSKFYEVLDTVIIIMKGKRSSTLQTYHHSGAMLCMWAGIRYMSSPIWMFATINSGIHALMYTYYTITAFKIRVPQAIKRSLTTMQITQFLVGASFAALHLFTSYTVPVSVPYEITEVITKTTASIVSSLTSPEAKSTATGAAVAILKRFIYRAAGEEGLAENIPVAGNVAPAYSAHAQKSANGQQVITDSKVVYRTEYQHVPCIDTSGQAFAVWLNVIYLAPLTFLFVRFFVKSYLRRTSPNTKHTTKSSTIAKSTQDAIHGVEREIESLGKAAEDSFASGVDRVTRGRTASSSSMDNKKVAEEIRRKASQRLEEIGEGEQATRARAKAIAKDVVSQAEAATSTEKPNMNGAINVNGNSNGRPKGRNSRKA